MTSIQAVFSMEPVDDSGWPSPLVEAYEHQRLALVRVAFLITGHREAAEEIVQDAFVATLRSWARVRHVAPYLRTAVVNGSRSWLRRQRLEREHAAPQRAEVTHADPDELWDVLSKLNDRQRAALVLRYYEGLQDEDIAGILGCRTGTVRTAIHRALAALRQEIER